MTIVTLSNSSFLRTFPYLCFISIYVCNSNRSINLQTYLNIKISVVDRWKFTQVPWNHTASIFRAPNLDHSGPENGDSKLNRNGSIYLSKRRDVKKTWISIEHDSVTLKYRNIHNCQILLPEAYHFICSSELLLVLYVKNLKYFEHFSFENYKTV